MAFGQNLISFFFFLVLIGEIVIGNFLNFSVGDYVGENCDNNYSTQLKNLDKLVKSLDSEILIKLDGSSKASSSSNLRRYLVFQIFYNSE